MTATSAIGIERFDMLRGQTFRRHVHRAHQLAWARSGVLMVDVEDRCWVLPPNLALWIPGGTPHATIALRESVMQGIYLDPDDCPLPWTGLTVLAVSALARNLIEYLTGDLGHDARCRAEAILEDVLSPVDQSTIELPLPADPRAREVADALLANPTDDRRLEDFARDIRSSPRTLLRLFLSETGMTFSQWRIHVRLQASIGHLAEGHPVGRVADMVGYSSTSAFVAAFRRLTGHTPAGYFTERAMRPAGTITREV